MSCHNSAKTWYPAWILQFGHLSSKYEREDNYINIDTGYKQNQLWLLLVDVWCRSRSDLLHKYQIYSFVVKCTVAASKKLTVHILIGKPESTVTGTHCHMESFCNIRSFGKDLSWTANVSRLCRASFVAVGCRPPSTFVLNLLYEKLDTIVSLVCR